MSSEAANSEFESLDIENGLVILRWPRGCTITGGAARRALDAVDTICAGRRLPLLVEMATTKSVAREARAVFCEPCAASKIAIMGDSPVDRVIANFTLGFMAPPCPTKFFTDRAQAIDFLRQAP